MKLITKLAAGAFVAIAFMAWQNDRENPSGAAMQRLHADQGMNRMSCTESELEGERWLACRYPRRDYSGSIWAWHDGAWIPRNSLAHRIADRALEHDAAPSAPIARLDVNDPEQQAWSTGLSSPGWENLK